MDKRKQFTPYILGATIGFLTLFMFNIPYLNFFNGYDIISIFSDFWSSMGSIFQLFLLFDAIALMFVGMVGILNQVGITNINLHIGKLDQQKINAILIYIFCGLTFLVFLFELIFAVSFNSIQLQMGSIIMLLLGIGTLIIYLCEMNYINISFKKKESVKNEQPETKEVKNNTTQIEQKDVKSEDTKKVSKVKKETIKK